jgi:hypothetical protein
MEKVKYNDYPFDEIAKSVKEKLKNGGVTCFQKFTCEKCGSRQTIDEPNTFYTEGMCEECKHVTNIKERGCNFMAVFSLTPEGDDILKDALDEIKARDT